ncbi:MAG: HDOD domain-containing protein [Gammaproteobacteria bacterium]|nr:HDOD domain-containing protein [Gammaproteobacteria bacterium]
MNSPGLSSEKSTRIRMLDDLPPLPKVAQLILHEISDENVDIKKLASVIEMDPGLVARIVGLANSAFFAPAEKIYSVADAIIKILGLNTVKSLALSILMASPFKIDKCKSFRMDAYWYVAMMTATIIRKLIPMMHVPEQELNPSVAYTSGLLHNIGLLVLVHCFSDDMEKVFSEESNFVSSKFTEIENNIIGMSHAEAGAVLSRKWHVPEEMAVVIENNQNPDYSGLYEKPTILIGLASKIAYQLYDKQHNVRIEDKSILKKLSIDSSHITRVIKDVVAQREEVEAIAHFMSYVK